MKLILISFLFLVTSIHSYSQYELEINVYSEPLDEKESVYIAGSVEEFGNWDPSIIRLNKISDSSWNKKFYFEEGTELIFKITRGSWNSEALYEEGKIPDNYYLKITRDTTVTLSVFSWRDKSKLHEVESRITGRIEYHKNFAGKDIRPRDILVWLPPDYEKNEDERYPVLYMHDGQNVFDPATSTFGVEWRADEIADSLIRAGAIENIIIVGINNTPARRIEYSHTDTGSAYMKFIVEELKPFIDKTYRTLPDRENTATGGSSMGGLISFMLLWEYSEIFSKAASFSPALKVETIDYVSYVVNYNGEKKDIKLYVDNGGVDLEKRLQPGIDEMLEVLQQKGYKINKDIIWYKDEDALHTEAAWSERLWRPLIFFFGK